MKTKKAISTPTPCKPCWLARVFADINGVPSSKRVLFALTVVATLGFVVGDTCHARHITSEAVTLLNSLLLYTGGAYVGGRFAEAHENK